MCRFLTFFILSLVIFCPRTEASPVRANYAPGEFVVNLNPSKYHLLRRAVRRWEHLSDKKIEKKIFSILRASVSRRAPDSNRVLVRAKHGGNLNLDVASILLEHKILNTFEGNPIYRTTALPNDPSFGLQWGLEDPSSGVAVGLNAPKAWDSATGTKDVVVAVIDTGIDYRHPDLRDNIWENSAEKFGQPGVDDDHNGYVDDVYGYDFINRDAEPDR